MLALFLVMYQIIPYDFLHEEERNMLLPIEFFQSGTDATGRQIVSGFRNSCDNERTKGTVNGAAVFGVTTYGDCGYNRVAKNDYLYNPSRARHYAFLFNTYVLLQVLNLFNARLLLPHEVNPFSNLFLNRYFLIIVIISVIV